ncbi:FecR/PupR family sigma factor regulator, partial [Vibrio cholerae]|uniref:FecR/PupR family sigma factor regulator n=1 Tax=Vibrio cholerae TaxID=666 RepID=UPI003D2FDB98
MPWVHQDAPSLRCTRTSVMTALPTADVLFEEASGWYFRLRAEDLTPVEMDAFAAWP